MRAREGKACWASKKTSGVGRQGAEADVAHLLAATSIAKMAPFDGPHLDGAGWGHLFENDNA